MSDWVRILDAEAVAPSHGTKVVVDDCEIAVFRLNAEWRAIENRCPHRGASLADGKLRGNRVTCPLHQWEFDLSTGDAIEHSGFRNAVLDIRVEGDGVWLDRDSIPVKSRTDAVDGGVNRYLVRYAAPGWIGLFGSVHEIEAGHRDPVIVQTDRGEELGEFLSDPSTAGPSTVGAQPAGELLRIATEEELQKHRKRSIALIDQLLVEAQQQLDREAVAVQVVDGELLFDGNKAILYYVGEASPALTGMRPGLAEESGLDHVEWSSLIEPEDPEVGCGNPGCGGGACQSEGSLQ